MEALFVQQEDRRLRRKLVKETRRLKRLGANRAAHPMAEPRVILTRPCRIQALVVLAITGSLFWILSFLLMHAPFAQHPELFPWADVGTRFFREWLDDPVLLAAVHTALYNVDDPNRFAADQYLRESVAIQMLGEQNRKGLPVPAATLILFYLQCWEARPGGELARAQCEKLQNGGMTYRKNWLRRFRAKWNLLHGPLQPPGQHADDEAITQRVPHGF